MKKFIVFVVMFVLLSNPVSADTKNGDWYVNHNVLSDRIGENVPLSFMPFMTDDELNERYSATIDDEIYFSTSCGYYRAYTNNQIITILCGMAFRNFSNSSLVVDPNAVVLLDNGNRRTLNSNDEFADEVIGGLKEDTIPSGQATSGTLVFVLPATAELPLRIEFNSGWEEPLVVLLEDNLDFME